MFRLNHMEYLRVTYRVPAQRGRRVMVDGKPGVITGAQAGRLRVRFDGEKKSRFCHPVWRVNYIQKEVSR